MKITKDLEGKKVLFDGTQTPYTINYVGKGTYVWTLETELEGSSFICEEDFKLYTEPKKTVKMYQAVTKDRDGFYALTTCLYRDNSHAAAYNGNQFVRLLTEYPIEVEVK